MQNRLTLWVSLIGLVFVTQLGWWGYLLWSQGEEIDTARLALLQLRRDVAAVAWRAEIEAGAQPAEAWQRIAAEHSGVVFVPGGGGSLQVDGGALAAAGGLSSGRRTMILGEGALFGVISILGLVLFLRVARRESYLVLQQSNFLHSVTHEFRSPLQGLRLAVESLIRRPDPDKARKYADGMLEDIGRLEGMVENVLAVGRLDAEAFRATPVRLDLSAHTRQVIDRFQGFAGPGAGRLEVTIEDGIQAEADPSTLEPILRNLLDNALKYGGEHPVRVELHQEGAYAWFTVKDQGRGFSSAERHRLFDRFWRAGDERVRTATGAGLGLHLVATLARAQGASVEAHSEGPGQGAEFRVRWPLATVQE